MAIEPTPFEVETCGALMLGSGTDAYDPLCELPRGHRGPCRSTAAIDQRRIHKESPDA